MSTVSGLASKEDKDKSSKQKYSSLNINNLYKGKSLESPKTAVVPKHGLQTLGKVGAIRRIPPPTNLPSLKSENAGNNPNVNLVPSGGQGWLKEKTQEECITSITQQATPDSLNSSVTGQAVDSCNQFHGDKNGSAVVAAAIRSQEQQQQALMYGSNAIASRERGNDSFNPASAAAAKSSNANSRSWSTITTHEEAGQAKSFLAHGSPYFPQEFPELDAGESGKEGDPKPNIDYSYGPGPSLRPQSEGSWSRGTGSTIKPSVSTASSSSSTQGGGGGGVNVGVGVPGQGIHPGITGPVPQSHQPQHMIGTANVKTVANPLLNNGNVVNGQSVCIDSPQVIDLHLQTVVSSSAPLQNFHMFGPSVRNVPGAPNLQQFRSMAPSYLYGRMPGSNFPGMVPPTHIAAGYPMRPNFPRAPYPDPNRARIPHQHHQKTHQQKSQSEDAGSSLSERKGMAPAILTDKDLKGFDEILDSEGIDDWVAPPNDIDYNAKLVFSDDEDSTPSHQSKSPTATKTNSLKNDSLGKSNESGKHSHDSRDEVRYNNREKECEKNDIPKYRPPMAKAVNQWPANAYPTQPESGKSNSDVQSSGSSSLTNYPPTKNKTDFPDDDEMWKQRSRQHSDEMIAAVERARKRREEEEKKFEASRLAALEKAKRLEEKTRLERQKSESREGSISIEDKENREKETRSRESRDDRSTHSLDSHEDKSSRDVQRTNQGNPASLPYGNKPFTKEVPPRFQKQAELQRQLKQKLQQLQHHQVHAHKPQEPVNQTSQSQSQVKQPQTPLQHTHHHHQQQQSQQHQPPPPSQQQNQQQQHANQHRLQDQLQIGQQQQRPQEHQSLAQQQQRQHDQQKVLQQTQRQPQHALQQQQQPSVQPQPVQQTQPSPPVQPQLQPQLQPQHPAQVQAQSQHQSQAHQPQSSVQSQHQSQHQPQVQPQHPAQAQPQHPAQVQPQHPIQVQPQHPSQQQPLQTLQPLRPLSFSLSQQLQQVTSQPQPQQPQQLQQLLQQHHQQKQSLANAAQLPLSQHHQLQHTHQPPHPQQQLPLHHQYQQQLQQFQYQQSFQHQFSAALSQSAIGAGFIPAVDKNALSEDLFEWKRDFKDNKWGFEIWGSNSSSLNERASSLNYDQVNHADDSLKERASHPSPDDKSDNLSDQLKHSKVEDSDVKSLSSSSARNHSRPGDRGNDLRDRRRRESDKIVRKPNSSLSSSSNSRSNQTKDKHSHERENGDERSGDFRRGGIGSAQVGLGAPSFRGGRREYRSTRLTTAPPASATTGSSNNTGGGNGVSGLNDKTLPQHQLHQPHQQHYNNDDKYSKNLSSNSSSRKITRTPHKRSSISKSYHEKDEHKRKNQIKGDSMDKNHPDNENSSSHKISSSSSKAGETSNRHEGKSGNDNNYDHPIRNQTTFTRSVVMVNYGPPPSKAAFETLSKRDDPKRNSAYKKESSSSSRK